MMEKILSLAECLEAATDTKSMVVRDGGFEEIPGILKRYFEGKSVFLIADENTFKAAGAAVLDTIKAAGIPVEGTYTFKGHGESWVHADYSFTLDLQEQFKGKNTVPVAVGGGTINDLVKRAASELGIPYLCIPTGASVDGYTAYGASLLHEGYKQTFPCTAPLAVAADSSVLAAAPAFMASSGFGDLAGKIVSGTDWIIADKVFDIDGTGALGPGSEKIEEKAWAMVQNSLWPTLGGSKTAVKGDKAAVTLLFEGLGITGFALQYLQNSRAVSGSEHMWSHVWEMEDLSVNGHPVTHGHKVAIGTLAAAAFTECLFAEKPPANKPRQSWAEREAAIRKTFSGLGAAETIVKTAQDKFIEDEKKVKQLREGILDRWDAIKEEVFKKLPPWKELFSLLKEAGCPLRPAESNLTREKIIATAKSAQMIRKRWTVLDTAYELGMMDDVVRRMEASELYFRD